MKQYAAQGLIELSIADVNQEMVTASMCDLDITDLSMVEEAKEMSRGQLAERLGLVKSGPDKVSLPQAFISYQGKNKEQVERNFLGFFSTVQYL